MSEPLPTPRIVGRRLVYESPFLRVFEQDVEAEPGEEAQVFWSVDTGRYAAVLALTEDGEIPLVRQFRPAHGRFVLELPSGAVDEDEEPEAAARRELREETGCEAGRLVPLGPLLVDSGRSETLQWAYFAPGARRGEAAPDPGEALEIVFVSPAELKRLVATGELDLGVHVAMVGRAVLAGLLVLE